VCSRAGLSIGPTDRSSTTRSLVRQLVSSYCVNSKTSVHYLRILYRDQPTYDYYFSRQSVAFCCVEDKALPIHQKLSGILFLDVFFGQYRLFIKRYRPRAQNFQASLRVL